MEIERDKLIALSDTRLGPPTPLVRVELLNYLNDAVKIDAVLADKRFIMPPDIKSTLEEDKYKNELVVAWDKVGLRKLAH